MIEFRLLQNENPLVEVFDVTPQETLERSLDEIRALTVRYGNRKVELADVFSVTGDSSDQHHIWHGDLSRVNGIGHRMTGGWVQINGDAGNHVGSRMAGGTIQVTGNVGDHAGAEMTDGTIHVDGSAGHYAGAAYDGGYPGQNGGAILIEGSAGNSPGKSMRRGLLAIGGDAGNCCGYLMRAGTIMVFGKAKRNVGLEMTRGTIVLANAPEKVPDGFVAGKSQSMTIVRLLDRYLTELGFRKSTSASGLAANFTILHGDQLRGGRGEILVADNSTGPI